MTVRLFFVIMIETLAMMLPLFFSIMICRDLSYDASNFLSIIIEASALMFPLFVIMIEALATMF